MFAIIDIETCGGKFEFRKGRITEICILKHDGLSVIEKFTSLVNPECLINPFFTGLTGITNEMVADAPKFHEIAPKIIEMTEGCVFVAHNVSFDYGFVKEEFNSLGYKFKRETLCTVRLSRKLLPNRISYSLGHLCASLGIEIEGRHRAEGDAVATAQLFDLLIRLKTQHAQYKNMGVTEIMTRRVDKIKQYVLNKLPEECGVYYFLNKAGEIIYIGKSNNMYGRALSHFNSEIAKSKKMLNDMYNVDYVVTGSELIALLLESEEIKKHKPKYNRMRKSEAFTHCIDFFKNKDGIINFKLLPYDESENGLLAFNSFSSARERLEQWIDKYELCMRYCGLTGSDAVCFNHQIKKCNGICAGEEAVEEYNKRAKEIIKQFRFKDKDFVILDKGRKVGEYSVVLVENGRYAGYGYYDSYEQISNAEEFKGFVSYKTYYPDADDLVRHFVKQGKRKIIKL
ncbi:MAG: GIY-YIG nuclease family protein [Bacteroidia bacterium]|nr:GIY-YIG nuclease family protein [Bacteroidia bacterium]